MTKSKMIAGLATAALLVIGGGTALAAAEFSPSPAASPAEDRRDDATPSGSASPAAEPKVSREDAERTALGKVAGGRVTSTELETEHGRLVWDVDVDAPDGTEHDVDIDAVTGEVVSQKVDDDRDEGRGSASPAASPAAEPKVSREDAERTALGKVAGGRVTSTELETEHGRLVWDIEVDAPDGTEHEFDIDAMTGAVVSQEVDDDDHSGRGGGHDDDRDDDKHGGKHGKDDN